MLVVDDMLNQVLSLITDRSGFAVRAKDLERLDGILAERSGSDPHSYFAELKSADRTLDDLIGEFTVKETHFFRAPEQLRVLRSHIRGMLADPTCRKGTDLRLTRPFRIWSAGCATGEEAYSIAAMLLDVAGESDTAALFDLMATDISRSALDVARSGRYQAPRVARGAEEDLLPTLLAHVEIAQDGCWTIDEKLRSSVTFTRHNIMANPRPEQVDALFCRNLMVYMAPAAQQRLLDRLWESLAPGGLLFLGDAELLHVLEHRFETLLLPEAVAYRRPLGDFGFGG